MKRFKLQDTLDHITAQAVIDGARTVPRGAVFIVVRGMILAHSFPVCVAEREMSFNQDVKAIVANESVYGGFLAHWLNGHSDQLLRLVTEATHGTKRIELSILRAFPFVRPPFVEQRRIAEVLDTIDEAIRESEQLVAKLTLMKQGLLHALLTRGIDDNGELRDPERHPEQFLDSPLGRIPRAWKISTVEEEFEIVSGVTLGPHRRPRKNTWPYLRVANVYRDSLDLSDVALLEALPTEVENRQLDEGDLLVVEGHANPEEIGRCAMVTREARGYTFQNHLFRLRTYRLHARFALVWMNSAYVRNYWQRMCSTSSGLNTINKTMLRALRVVVPTVEEQTQIVERVHVLACGISAEQDALAKLRLIKQGLMEDLLTGRVRVTDLATTP